MSIITNVSPIEFVERTNQNDYIKIIDKGEYFSYDGKRGGEQDLSVTARYSNPVGKSMHELMHSLGFYLEHCRPDCEEPYINLENSRRRMWNVLVRMIQNL
ncbi:hypothetical protein C1646_777607 [Rhizophagus diaphanus]|nr:hypothetical protein C1646_777607 [Rhizophagus diaphanus] [Rhizophagus sp. MUCL 43196]